MLNISARNYGTGSESLVIEIPPYLIDEILSSVGYAGFETTYYAKQVIDRWRAESSELNRRHKHSHDAGNLTRGVPSRKPR